MPPSGSAPTLTDSTVTLRKVIDDMTAALQSQSDGVAIAAPQVGYPLRIFLISGHTFQYLRNTTEPIPNKLYINPRIVNHSRRTEVMEEGCLSVRWLYGKVERFTKATVKAYSEDGTPFQEGASGLLAQIFQHEIDHLDGVLFIDKATDVQNMPPDESKTQHHDL